MAASEFTRTLGAAQSYVDDVEAMVPKLKAVANDDPYKGFRVFEAEVRPVLDKGMRGLHQAPARAVDDDDLTKADLVIGKLRARSVEAHALEACVPQDAQRFASLPAVDSQDVALRRDIAEATAEAEAAGEDALLFDRAAPYVFNVAMDQADAGHIDIALHRLAEVNRRYPDDPIAVRATRYCRTCRHGADAQSALHPLRGA